MNGSSSRSGRSLRKGAVTFLDVLGWKGIWGRHDDPVSSLESLIKAIEERASELGRGRGEEGLQTNVLSISDTVVLLTHAPDRTAKEALDLHGQLCAFALPESIHKGTPLRGATAYGEFMHNERGTIFVGRAIDEAASWYELADWIGVFMTPSAYYVFQGAESSVWRRWRPPLKEAPVTETLAVLWSEDLESVRQSFVNLAPILPEYANKFANTLCFLECGGGNARALDAEEP